ncbi:hypothetical protein [Stenotrophomonas maltophilia]|uniref:hypothetical protein n=1 Tax=Stenotrophomonas maltophilia TaxID=40324 RepID=UPI000F65CCF8|nr:hypothetical protein [Stenotrophomonas maltophilia]
MTREMIIATAEQSLDRMNRHRRGSAGEAMKRVYAIVVADRMAIAAAAKTGRWVPVIRSIEWWAMVLQAIAAVDEGRAVFLHGKRVTKEELLRLVKPRKRWEYRR